MAKKKKVVGKKRAAKKPGAGKTKTSRKKSAKVTKKSPRKWAREIKTDSTKPPSGLFKEDADTVANAMASKKVSPGGIGSGIRMVQMYINRAGKNLSKVQKQELEKAKRKLQAKNKKAEPKSRRKKKANGRER